jgi:hypothetical protein
LSAPAHRKPLAYRLVERIGSALRSAGLPLAELDEQRLVDGATRKAGLDDFGDAGFRDGLRELLRSAREDARLHFIGRMAVQGVVLTALSNRLLLAREQRRDPELGTRALDRPLIVLGLPRSGTTLLHRLLAEDPQGRAVPAWELLRPVAPGGRDRRRALAARQMKLIHAYAPWADRIHATHPDAPEECMVLLASTFESALYWAIAPVYGYLDWLLATDPHRAYAEYRAALQILARVAPDRRLVLKSPSHTAHLATLCETLPEALLVQCHRDPLESVVSVSSLFRAAHGILSDDLDVPRTARVNLELLGTTAEQNLVDRRTWGDRVYDVDYRDLVADPIGVVRGVYQRFELEWSDALDQRLRRYMARNPRGKHGAHRYRAEDFGLSERLIADRFTDYRRQFGFDRPPRS